jgi:protein phosphatase PTC2/3
VEGLYGSNRKGLNTTIGTALKKTFLSIDETFYSLHRLDFANKCGTTACIVLIVGPHIFCANIGDSRAVLSHKGVAVNLSLDHKACRQDEVARIERNHGLV